MVGRPGGENIKVDHTAPGGIERDEHWTSAHFILFLFYLV